MPMSSTAVLKSTSPSPDEFQARAPRPAFSLADWDEPVTKYDKAHFSRLGEREMNRHMVTTMQTLPGYAIAKNLEVVRGLTVRSRSIVGNILGRR